MSIASDVHDNPDEQRFELPVDGALAIAEYRLDGPVITFTHTFVPEALRGRGIATRVVEGSLAAVRARGLSVEPQCATFVGYIRSHPETQDLLTPDARDALGS